MDKSTAVRPILILGVGIFFFLAVSSIAFVPKDLFRRFLIMNGSFDPILVMILSELIEIIIYVVSAFGLIKIMKNRSLSVERIFYYSIGLLVLGQILGGIIPVVFSGYQSIDYYKNLNVYYESINLNVLYSSLPSIFSFVLYIILAIIFYKNRNLIVIESADGTDLDQIGN